MQRVEPRALERAEAARSIAPRADSKPTGRRRYGTGPVLSMLDWLDVVRSGHGPTRRPGRLAIQTRSAGGAPCGICGRLRSAFRLERPNRSVDVRRRGWMIGAMTPLTLMVGVTPAVAASSPSAPSPRPATAADD